MSAIHQLITDHIDIWTAADTEKKSGRGRSSGNAASVYGIKKLRELILELAVRGKLVPQDPNDEPASELLKKIQAEKAKLIANGKIKKELPPPRIGEEEKPFDLPCGWAFTRFGDALINRDAERIPVSSSERLSMKGEYDYYGASGVIDKVDKYLFDKPLLLIGEDGANLINRSTPIAFIARGKYWVNNHAHVLDGLNEEFLKYVELHINAIDLKPYVTGTAQPKMNQAKMNGIVLALPPEKEQHRIVAKVDELMALCDQLETQHNNAAEAHEKLVSQLLATLTQSQNAEEFSENWQRIAAHFDTLFTTEASIDALKQTLLQLAVMGKLVPQDPNDEPASELLKKIQAEKAKLIAEGKIKKEKSLPPISEDENSYDLPAGWQWTRVGNLFDVISGGSFESAAELAEGKFPYVKVADMNIPGNEIEITTSSRFVNPVEKELRGIIPANSIIFPKRGGAIATNKKRLVKTEIFADLNIMAMTIPFPVSLDYVFQWLNGIDLALLNSGTSVPQINHKDIDPLNFPLPPLSEQHRIVAKVNELMALCDQLKSRITEANRLQQKLADVVVEQALSSEFLAEEAAAPNRNEARALLGAEIIHQLHTEKTFGQVKLQKIVHLCEYIADIEAVAGEYQRYAAGPHDPDMIADIESSIQQNEWYEEFQRDKFGHAYRALSHAGEHRKKLGAYWQGKLPIIQKLIDVMRKWDTERCEIFSTLYAAWNDLLIFGKSVSDDAILSEVLERWNDSKTKIPKKNWLEGLEWMRKESFIPKGTGRATRAEGLFD